MKKAARNGSRFTNRPARCGSTKRRVRPPCARCSSRTWKTAARWRCLRWCLSIFPFNKARSRKGNNMQASPYGLESLWLQGDAVTKGIAVLLIAMSIASWYVMLTKAWQVLRFRRAAHAAARRFWDTTSLEQGVATLGQGNPFHDLAQTGINAMRHHTAHKGHLHDQLSVSDRITLSLRQAIDDATAKLQAGMAALGLAVAIPATCGYNALVRGNKFILAQLNKFGFDLHALFVTGERATDPHAQGGAKLSVVKGA